MKERPILFSGEMVRAILEGRKTMTRRVVKPSKYFHTQCDWYMPHSGGGWWGHDGPHPDCIQECGGKGFYCPYGVPGDRLWVRETWNAVDCDDSGLHWNSRGVGGHGERECMYWEPIYKATCKNPSLVKWMPSIYMPRWASRITLEVKDVRVERVQDITESDAEAEGMRSLPIMIGERRTTFEKEFGVTMRDSFRDLWDSINAKRGYGWDTNPWVWVVKFEVVNE